jgi:hypothetical protein
LDQRGRILNLNTIAEVKSCPVHEITDEITGKNNEQLKEGGKLAVDLIQGMQNDTEPGAKSSEVLKIRVHTVEKTYTIRDRLKVVEEILKRILDGHRVVRIELLGAGRETEGARLVVEEKVSAAGPGGGKNAKR